MTLVNLFSKVEMDNEKLVFSLHVNALRYIYRMSTKDGGVEQIGKWRLDSNSQRTILWYDITNNGIIKQRNKKTYRNPIILAREMSLMMEIEELSRAELARKLNLSRARVTQMLNLLGLPEMLISEIEGMGDHWSRQLVTERQLRRLNK